MRLHGSAALLAAALFALGCEEQPATDPGQPAPETAPPAGDPAQPNGTGFENSPQQSPYPPPQGPGAEPGAAQPGANGAGQQFPQTAPGAGFDQSPPQDDSQSRFPPPADSNATEQDNGASPEGGAENG